MGAAKFKVGDRVRVLPRDKSLPYSGHGAKNGQQFTVRRVRGDAADNLDTELWCFFDHEVELVTPSLTIQAGRYYKTRDGRKVGPMEVWGGMTSSDDGGPLFDTRCADFDGCYWQQTGTSGDSDSYCNSDLDLIAEWPTEAPVFAQVDAIAEEYGPVSSVWSAPTTLAIVALIENGQPKTSTLPYVHTSERSASVEAQRLADLHKGQKFGVFVLTASTEVARPAYKHEWQRLAADGKKISAIKELQSLTGMMLKPAKDVVEHFIDRPYTLAA